MSKMISNIEAYFRQFVPSRDEVLLRLEEEARQEHIPIVGPVVGELLYLLASVIRAKLILELGTATGYSAIYLARGCAWSGGRVLTLEQDQDMAYRAEANFREAGLSKQIEIRIGDALDTMSNLDGPVDFIFMDIDKEGYLPVLSHCQRLLKRGGLLVTDNVGFRASADFNQAIFESPEWRCVHLLSLLPQHSPEQDGLCIALRV